MTHGWPIYLVLLIVVAARTRTADVALRVAAGVLFIDWLGSNALHWFAPFEYRPFFPASDLALAVAFLCAWIVLRRPWLTVLSALYAVSSLVGWLSYGLVKNHSFDLALNAAFLARLAVVWISSSEPRKLQEIR